RRTYTSNAFITVDEYVVPPDNAAYIQDVSLRRYTEGANGVVFVCGLRFEREEGFRAPLTDAPRRPVYHKLRDQISVLDAMPLSLGSAIVNREVTASDAPEITSIMQGLVTDAVDQQRSIFAPSGVYYLNDKLEVLKSGLVIRGESPSATQFSWTSNAVDQGLS